MDVFQLCFHKPHCILNPLAFILITIGSMKLVNCRKEGLPAGRTSYSKDKERWSILRIFAARKL